jgi:multicomponent Na+:H+ antiporter subunit E
MITRRIATRTDDDTIRLSPVGVIVFAGHVVWQLVKSNLVLAWEIVTPRNTIATGSVDVPLRSASPVVAMAVSNVVTLTPGTATIDMTEVPPTLTVGVLHLHDPDQIRRSVVRTETLAIRAFGTVGARAALRKEAP